nr:immunoglobulin heavy chain junction region [Mus musculus]MBK4184885.1 immunoglobulin heavy chain junction region [Mus musculus]
CARAELLLRHQWAYW